MEPEHETEYYEPENTHDAHDYSNADPDNAWVECYDEYVLVVEGGCAYANAGIRSILLT